MTHRTLTDVVAAERDIYEFPWTRGNFRDSLSAGYSCLELREEGGAALLGYAVMMFGPEEAHLLNLSILPPVQRRHYGEQLLAVLVGLARSRGARRMFLEVRPSNHAAQRLYQRAGFHLVGRRRNYYPSRGGREDALLLNLEL